MIQLPEVCCAEVLHLTQIRESKYQLGIFHVTDASINICYVSLFPLVKCYLEFFHKYSWRIGFVVGNVIFFETKLLRTVDGDNFIVMFFFIDPSRQVLSALVLSIE